MAAAISVATIRNTAYNVIKTQEVRRLVNGDFSMEDFTRFEKDLLRASQAVPSTLGGGQHGHTWLVKNEADYKSLTGDDSLVQLLDGYCRHSTNDKIP